ncbi:DUF1090 family protein [Providencia rettgeri]|uniref:DUF1090 family protein n=1 Tax=Providencia rettgeri TaxID=587 RepID=UPI0034E0B403
MKKPLILVLLLTIIPLSSQASANDYRCEKKIIKLEKQLRHLSHHENRHKIAKIKKKIHEIEDKCYDSRSGATRIYNNYPRGNASELERELESLRRVIEALKDLK